ncbi:hypothetical protein DSO57_1013878 [Entomophthora muscae]|uniref:Uncharacterized protein n=1 Tax=Entomophthora muscae TaxID=34485 RepID=A0ACC2U3Y3_9FUNG|nr:hypothetical protein DSO57_1013878 [Entomophthora muscae]
MSKLLHETVFFRLTETGLYNFKGGKLDFNKCSVKVIPAKPPIAPPLTTSPPPALAAILEEHKYIFSETLDQLLPPQEIQHAVQFQESYPQAHLLYCLNPNVTKLTVSKPRAGIKPASSHQAGLAGRGDLLAPGFSLFKANPGAGIIPALVAAEEPVLGPKSYA